MLLLPFVLDSLFFATPKSKRVLMRFSGCYLAICCCTSIGVQPWGSRKESARLNSVEPRFHLGNSRVPDPNEHVGMAVFVSSSSVCGLIVFFFVSHVLACLLNACMSPLCLLVVSLHPCLMLFIRPSFPLVCTLCVVDAHKPPSSYGTHVARWFGARIVHFLRLRGSLALVVRPYPSSLLLERTQSPSA